MSAPTPTGAPTWVDFVTVDQGAQWIGLNNPDPFPFGLIVSMACDWVQSFLDRPVTPTQFVRRFDSESAKISLPYTPLISVDLVTEAGGVDAFVLPESTPTAYLDGYQVDYTSGTVTRVNGIYPKQWLPGSRNIEVTWTAGYQSPPAKVLVATLELIKHWWENAVENPAINSGPSATADYAPEETTGMWTGIPARVESMLEPMLRIGIG